MHPELTLHPCITRCPQSEDPRPSTSEPSTESSQPNRGEVEEDEIVETDAQGRVLAAVPPKAPSTSKGKEKASINATDSVSTPDLPCYGLPIPLPPGKTGYGLYPFLIHKDPMIAWIPRFDFKDNLHAQSKLCRGTRTELHACFPCRQLVRIRLLQGVISRMNEGCHENMPRKWLGLEHSHEGMSRKDDQLNTSRLDSLNLGRALMRRTGKLDAYKRFVMAIGSGDVRRVGALVRAGVNNGMGINGLIELMTRANFGLYRPHGYSRAERQQTILFWKLAGARLAGIGHRVLGLPCVRTVQKSPMMKPIHASPSMPTAKEISANIDAIFSGTSPPPRRLGYVLMIDEIAVEKRLRWDPSNNNVLGLCREHSSEYSTTLNTEADLNVITKGLETNDVHLASEATVVGLGALCRDGRTYSCRPILVSGTCKHETAKQHTSLLRTVLAACREKADRFNGRIYCIATDGEQKRGKALAPLTMTRELDGDSQIFGILTGLRFFNYACGDDDITQDKDYKHNGKRFRSNLCRAAGICVGGVVITTNIVERHLLDEGWDARTVNAFLNSADKQDVVAAYRLLTAIAALPTSSTKAKSNPAYADDRRALNLLGKLYNSFLEAYTSVNLTLQQQLTRLSYVAHLIFVLYTAHKGAFMPVQLYHDLQTMVKNAYFCVAKTKVDDPDGEFWLILLGEDRTEELFGDIRTMAGGDSNVDVLQLSSRASGAAECANILAENPSWDCAPRRLRIPTLIAQKDDIHSSVDHINPNSWIGDVHVSGVELKTAWKEGRQKVEEDAAYLNAAGRLATLKATAGVDMLCPFGKYLYDDGALVAGEVEEEEDVEGNIPPEANGSRVPLEGAPPSDQELDELVTPDIEDLINTSAAMQGDDQNVQAWTAFLTINGEDLHKAALCRRASSPYYKAISYDRLKRVQGKSKLDEDQIQSLLLDGDTDLADEPSLFPEDPIATILRCETGQIFLALVKVTGMKYDGKRVGCVPLRSLASPTVLISFQVLRLARKLSTVENPTDWYWVPSNYEEFERNRAVVLEASGPLFEPLNPVVGNPPNDSFTPTWHFQSEELRGIGAVIMGRASAVAAVVPSIKISGTYPYRTAAGACGALTTLTSFIDDIF